MKSLLLVLIFVYSTAAIFAQSSKAPAYPLITHDPYFSIWSMTDELNASPTKHWTGTDQSLIGLLDVDGITYRFLGATSTQYKSIVPAGDEMNYEAAYTESTPSAAWMNADFDDSQWKKGKAPFGNNIGVSKTIWNSKDIWVRRWFSMDKLNDHELFFKLQYDDDVQVYLNGK